MNKADPSAKVVLVTGAGAGIGYALSCELAARGHVVYAGVRDMERGRRDYADLLGNDACRLQLVQLDVNRPPHVRKVLRQIIRTESRLDQLVNNAGFGMYGAFEELSDQDFRSQFETNFFSVLELCRSVIPIMRQQGQGQIYNISSILGLQALPTGTAYTSSKFALEAFSESLRYELDPFGIQVVLIEPGLIRTNFKTNMQLADSSSRADSPYRFLNQMIQRDYNGINTSKEAAAQRLAAIMSVSRPKTRYRIGLDSHLLRWFQILTPERLRDVLVRMTLRRKFKPAGRVDQI
ncbi:MAG: SDR family oxidoreductase [Leptospiraceae bacterium]|nr:SDR family oxidoreductase [Leptospiraceae bacterium]